MSGVVQKLCAFGAHVCVCEGGGGICMSKSLGWGRCMSRRGSLCVCRLGMPMRERESLRVLVCVDRFVFCLPFLDS